MYYITIISAVEQPRILVHNPKKSADLIAQGLYKCLEKKPLNNIKVNDIHLNTYVYRATMVFTSFVICYKEKGKKSVEEIMEENNKMVRYLVNFWKIG